MLRNVLIGLETPTRMVAQSKVSMSVYLVVQRNIKPKRCIFNIVIILKNRMHSCLLSTYPCSRKCMWFYIPTHKAVIIKSLAIPTDIAAVQWMAASLNVRWTVR